MKKCIFLIFTCSLIGQSLWAQIEPSLRFRRYGIEEGLSQVTARCILEDKLDGHIWIGTQDGLNQFDGYRFKVFKHASNDPSSVSSNRVNTLFQDADGRIWIGTSFGLNVYDRHSESFRHVADVNTSSSLSHSNVTSIAQDQLGNLWIGTENGLNVFDIERETIKHFFEGATSLSSNKVTSVLVDDKGVVWVGTVNGLNRYDQRTDSFTHFTHDASNRHSISSNEILTLFQDAQANLWIGTSLGLNLFEATQGAFRRYLHDRTNARSLSNDDIRSIAQDRQNRIWVGTRWGGITILDKQSNTFQRVVNQPEDPNSLSNNTVLSMMQDSRGNMWVGVSGKGLNVHNPRTQRFTHYKHIHNNPNSLLDEGVWGMIKDHRNRLWVATYEGVSIIGADGTIRHMKHDPEDATTISSNQITSIYQDKQQRIWIGTIYGLNLYNPKTNGFVRFTNDQNDTTSLSHDLVWCIFQDRQYRIWVGTDAGGLNQLDPTTGTFKRFAFNGKGNTATNHFRIKCITQSQDGQLWIGTDMGVNRLHPETGKFDYYTHDPSKPNSIGSNIVRTIAEDKVGRLFIGTEGGLCLYNPKTNDFKIWKEKDGLSNEVIYGILIDRKNNLWLSTNKGINKFTTSIEKFIHFDKYDGLQSDEFNTGAYYKDKDGYMYFGGVNGLSIFHPDSIQQNTYVPPVLITDFQLFNQSVSINDSTVLSQSLTHTNEITLDYDDDIFSFTFAALSFEQPEKIKYAYKLEPFHREWLYTDYTDRKAVLTRIPAGEYTFRVKVANEDGIWSETSRNMIVRVLPPWYETGWAKGLFIFSGLALVVVIVYLRERNARQIRRNLEETVAEKTVQLKAEKEEVSKQLAEKEILMQEVHHRVKNNLTFLKGLLYLRAKASDDLDVKRILNECQTRIESMALVHQNLYDIEDSSKVNFDMFLRELFIQLLATMEMDSKKIDFTLDVRDVKIDMKTSIFLGLILNELITNSFKYAFHKGEGVIYIQALDLPNAIEINYADSGEGLPDDFDLTQSGGFGFKMIRILNDQLGSDFQYLSSNKKTFRLIIPKE